MKTAIKPANSKPANSIAIDGQTLASKVADDICQTAIENGASTAATISGPAGVGKSHLTREIEKKMKAAGWNVLTIADGGQVQRADSVKSEALVQALEDSANGGQTVILADEFHNFPINPFNAKSPMERLCTSLIYGSGEGWKRFAEVEFQGKGVTYNTANILFFGITNKPEKIGKGKNQDAIDRRFTPIVLKPYSVEDMRRLVPVFFREKGVKITPEAVRLMLNLHRYTFEAAGNVLDVCLAANHGDKTKEITRNDIIGNLSAFRFTLGGFTWDEIACLQWLANTHGSTKRGTIEQMHPKVAGDALGALMRHASNQYREDKKNGELIHVPFMQVAANGSYFVTDIGKAWLATNADKLTRKN